MREEKPSSLRLTKSSNGCFSIVQVNMIHWTRASRSLDNIPVLMILAVHIYAGFSMSIGSVMSGGLDALDFPESEFATGLDPNYSQSSIDPLGRTTEEFQKNLDVNRARSKDDSVWHLLHELDRRSRLLSKWHSLRALRFG
ncbi:hypothetical protein FBUS_08033 [Fasciolopsis buskii]|uniref:Uncharacterized protein n=1 Tax=Fasciolopsis buskii TaxID=27845 RepID=A0A8E0RRH8_9TREM|nr:hypothetical protein FBUS_08033 [Fasciolopsis buski]